MDSKLFAPSAPALDFWPTTTAPTQIRGVSLIALPVLHRPDGPVVPFAEEVASDTGIDLQKALIAFTEQGDAQAGNILDILVSTPPSDNSDLRRVVLFGVDDASPEQVRRAAGALARRTQGHSEIAVCLRAIDDDQQLEGFVEGSVLGAFSLSAKEQQPARGPERIHLVHSAAAGQVQAALTRARYLATAAWQARRLATMPSNIKSPQWLADEVEQLVADQHIKTTRFDQTRLAKEGFGGILAVGAGSATPPVLLQLEYRPKRTSGSRRDAHVVLVGKGITFDTGGISIKPAEAMANMKRDMTGAAVVAAVMSALDQLKCQVKVTALLPIAENAVSGSAARPGDVITHYGGRTTEVTNTDAEGRLVLADALAYAVNKLKPTTVVDIATLTGGAKVALGTRMGALFATQPDLAAALTAAAKASGEPLWELPLSGEYSAKLSSKVADSVNSSGGPAAITAALFLQNFVQGADWAHLDIASSGDAEDDRFEWTKGPTGFGARTLLRWLTHDEATTEKTETEETS